MQRGTSPNGKKARLSFLRLGFYDRLKVTAPASACIAHAPPPACERSYVVGPSPRDEAAMKYWRQGRQPTPRNLRRASYGRLLQSDAATRASRAEPRNAEVSSDVSLW